MQREVGEERKIGKNDDDDDISLLSSFSLSLSSVSNCVCVFGPYLGRHSLWTCWAYRGLVRTCRTRWGVGLRPSRLASSCTSSRLLAHLLPLFPPPRRPLRNLLLLLLLLSLSFSLSIFSRSQKLFSFSGERREAERDDVMKEERGTKSVGCNNWMMLCFQALPSPAWQMLLHM